MYVVSPIHAVANMQLLYIVTCHYVGKSGECFQHGFIIQPQMRALTEHLQKMEHDLCLHILNKPKESYLALKLSCEDYIKSLIHGDQKSEKRILTDDRELMCQEIKRFWNQADIRFLEMIINLCGSQNLLSYLKDFHSLKQEHLSTSILQWGKNSTVCHKDGPHLIVRIEGYPHIVSLKMIEDLQQFLPKLGLCQSFFQGYAEDTKCIILYFLINEVSVELGRQAATKPTHCRDLEYMGVLSIGVPKCWMVHIRLEVCKLHITIITSTCKMLIHR